MPSAVLAEACKKRTADFADVRGWFWVATGRMIRATIGGIGVIRGSFLVGVWFYTTPWSSMQSATFTKPAMFAPMT